MSCVLVCVYLSNDILQQSSLQGILWMWWPKFTLCSHKSTHILIILNQYYDISSSGLLWPKHSLLSTWWNNEWRMFEGIGFWPKINFSCPLIGIETKAAATPKKQFDNCHKLILISVYNKSIKSTLTNNINLWKVSLSFIPFCSLVTKFLCPLKGLCGKKLSHGRHMCCFSWGTADWLVKNTILQTLWLLPLTKDAPNPWENQISWKKYNKKIHISTHY